MEKYSFCFVNFVYNDFVFLRGQNSLNGIPCPQAWGAF